MGRAFRHKSARPVRAGRAEPGRGLLREPHPGPGGAAYQGRLEEMARYIFHQKVFGHVVADNAIYFVFFSPMIFFIFFFI